MTAKKAKAAPKAEEALPETVAPAKADERPVLDLEGVGETYAKKLEENGIKTIGELRAADADQLAEKLESPPATVRNWQAMGELMEVPGLGPQYSELLVRSGTTSVSQLAASDAKDLVKAIEATNEGRTVRIQGNAVSAKVAKKWVEAAKSVLPADANAEPPVEVAPAEATPEPPAPEPEIQKIEFKPRAGVAMEPDPHLWIKEIGVKTTLEVKVPELLIDQVLGQEEAVAVAKQAAEQKRHLLLIGDPGTGKSMIAKALAEILPVEKLNDVLVYHNDKNPNTPKIVQVPGGTARGLVHEYERKARRMVLLWRIMEWIIALAALAFGIYMWVWRGENILVFLFIVLIVLLFLYAAAQKRPKIEYLVPKLLIEHSPNPESAPYIDGTGAHAGALLGDVRHDPYQSGGLETPPHVRVEGGAIHRAHKGVLFIDEINVLRLPSQQALLTALQEGKYAILGQSQNSAGAMVKTDPVPCEFILVAAGNLDAVRPASEDMTGGMHPALRSRIRGYGYEVFVNHIMDDNEENRLKMIQFVAQEVVRDGRIPHFDAGAVAEIIREGQRRAGVTGKLTLRLRELGGLVRTGGDYARRQNADIVTVEHVRLAKGSARSLEQQIIQKQIEQARISLQVDSKGLAIGVANGLGIVGTGEVGEPAGVVIPVEAAVVPAFSRHAGSIVLGHNLKEAHGSGVENVGAILKIVKGAEISNHDLHIDATITHPDAEAEGIGLAAAAACISALEQIPVKQNVVMAGSITVNGDLRPCRATLQRIEAAAELGYTVAIVPAMIEKTLLVDDYIREKIKIIFCRTLGEVLDHVLVGPAKIKNPLVQKLHIIVRTSNSNGSSDEAPVAVKSRAKAAKN